ncbi:MAG TPA: hypothetical protein VGY76_05525 [Solirubrobacteraceae bacterium]|jgi:hypothetical protein|nr:hypothetical protein [Solirubrobacteraceae bacterium]
MSDPTSLLREAMVSLEQETKRQAFVLVRPFDHILPDRLGEEIKRVHGQQIPESHAPLDVVLESDGGQADAAYKAILIFRSVTNDLRVLVPRWAKSAATLFALGANGIAMTPALAELGPLDAQVIDPRNPARMMSALDGYQSVEYLRDYALQTQNLAVRQSLARTRNRIPLGEVIERSESFAVGVISPIMSQVKPLDFGGWGRTLDIGKAYAERLLTEYGMADSEDFDPRETANQLVYGYPHHGFVIDLDEAKALGLNAAPMDEALHGLSCAVVDRAFACRQEVCEEGGHRMDRGYCGYAPEEDSTDEQTADDEPLAGEEVPENGSENATDADELRQRIISKAT